MRLYHHPMSPNARRASITALHLGVPVKLVLIDLAKGEHRDPWFLKLNPNHKVPVLQDEDFALWESYAIIQYLAEKTPGQTVYPIDNRARADLNRWLFWCAQHFAPNVGILNWENFMKGAIGLGGPDATEVKRGEQQFIEFGGVLDAHLADRDWICGGKLTLADLSLAAPLADTVRAKLPMDGFANINRWFATVWELDAWKKTEPRSGPSG
jgi:glutathione S-transferase